MQHKFYALAIIFWQFLSPGVFLQAQTGENHAFQWRFENETRGDMRNLDVLPLPDRGYMLAGIMAVDSGSALHFPYLMRTDCQGNTLWAKTFIQSTEGANNTDARIIALPGGDFLLLANVGFYFTTPYNDILAARLDGDGNLVWAHRIGGGSGDFDVVQDAVMLADGHVVLCGKTSSHGSDKGSNVYTDQYFLKLDPSDGHIVWSKTIGNPQAVDRCYAILETPDGGLAAAGSYLHGGTFQANLLKMDSGGNLLWHKVFGDATAPHANHAYGLLQTADGGFLLTGSSTNGHINFQDYPDFLVIKTDASGTAEWARLVAGGGPDLFENAVNAAPKPNGEYVIACATASYPTDGFVPNKYVLVTLSPDGAVVNARALNGGGSHYPRLFSDPYENSLLVSGFTNWPGYGGNNIRFDPILINLNAGFTVPSCDVASVTALTSVLTPAFEFDDAPSEAGSGGSIVSNIIGYQDFTVLLDVVCESNAYTSCTPFTPTAETGAAATAFEIFPNPASPRTPVSMRWPAAQDVKKIEIFDAGGRLVEAFEPVPGLRTLDLRLRQAGLYFVRAQGPGGNQVAKLRVEP